MILYLFIAIKLLLTFFVGRSKENLLTGTHKTYVKAKVEAQLKARDYGQT